MQDFAQVIAIDASFVLFSRAWCVAEIATAHKLGLRQSLKIRSLQTLEKHEGELRSLHIENMEATRPEDKGEILKKIGDPALFDNDLQVLLFQDLLPAWRDMDVASQLDRVGHIMRWRAVAQKRGSLRIYNPETHIAAPDNIGAQTLDAELADNSDELPQELCVLEVPGEFQIPI